MNLDPRDYQIGDEVVYRRSMSTWSRIASEDVHGVVVAITQKRIRIRLTSGIISNLTALVRPDRLRKL